MSNKNSENVFSIRVILSKYMKSNNLTIEKFSKESGINFETAKSYAQDQYFPKLNNLTKICDFFGVSIDFFVLMEECIYPKNLTLINLAKQIEREKPEQAGIIISNISAFVKKQTLPSVQVDDESLELTSNIHENIKYLLKHRNIKGKDLARMLDVQASQITHYRNKSVPPIAKLVKLSQIFKVSVHALATGQKLGYLFKTRQLENAVKNADHLLPLVQQNALIMLMGAMVE